MALFRKFFYRKPPDGLLEISDRVFVFDCCFSMDIWEDSRYKIYIGGIVNQLRDNFPDASFMVFNFREGEYQSQIASLLSDYDMTVMDYPLQYEGCPLLTMEMILHFLKATRNWLSLGQQNLILVHCEQDGWPVLAFMLASLLIYRKQFTCEQKTLDMIYKQAPHELLQLMYPINPLPSQLRYLQYVSKRNVDTGWPPSERVLTLDCIILRFIPTMDKEGGCRPIFRIYGQDPFMAADQTPKVLFSTPMKSKLVRHYKQDCELVKIGIHCHVIGDVVLECISLDHDQERELIMFRVMFNTAFIRSNILLLNREEIDILWNAKDLFPKDFRAEFLFSEMEAATSAISVDFPGIEERDGLSMEAFAKVQEIFSNADWLSPKKDVENLLPQISLSDILHHNLWMGSPEGMERAVVFHDNKFKERSSLQESESITRSPTSAAFEKQSSFSFEPSLVALRKPAQSTLRFGSSFDPKPIEGKTELQETPQEPEHSKPSIKPTSEADSITKKAESQDIQVALQQPAQPAFSSKLTLDVNSIRKKIEPQEFQVALQRTVQPRIISQQVNQSSICSPVPYLNSLQGSPGSISRYRSAPSALGITALLHDHAVSTIEERMHPVTLPLSSSALSSPIYNTPNSLQPSLSITPSPPSPGIQFYNEAPPVTKSSPTLSPLLNLKETDTKHSQTISAPSPLVETSPLYPLPLSPLSLPPFSSTSHAPVINRSLQSPSLTAFLSLTDKNLFQSPPASLPPPVLSGISPSSTAKNSFSATIPPPPPPPAYSIASSTTCTISPPPQLQISEPPPSPPPRHSESVSGPTNQSSVPQPPPPPNLGPEGPSSNNSAHVPPVPAPPTPCAKGLSKSDSTSIQSHSVSNGNVPPIPGPPPLNMKGRGTARTAAKHQTQPRKSNLRPYHWLKLTRAMQGSLWAEAQKPEEASKAPEFDMSELERLFSVAAPGSENSIRVGKLIRPASGHKSEKVHLIELRRAYNCEIMLTKVKIPLPELMSSVLSLDDTDLDADQVENLIRFCPTKEEMELLKNYNGDKESLGKCEQFFLELMKVPQAESKLRVFLFKIQFCSQVSDLRKNLNIINSATEEVRSSVKLKRIMQTVLSLGNALNHGTARGSAVGFRLDSLLKLTDTRARNSKMTLMHYLCKVLVEKLPEVLDFPKDLVTLEASTKIQLKYLAEEMQAISKGMENVVEELAASENDGPVSQTFCRILNNFLSFAEGKVRSLGSLYCSVGRNADALAHYFGEDPARCPFEQVVSTLHNFVRMFVRAHKENCKQLELENKKAHKEAENEKMKISTPTKEPECLIKSPI